MFSAPAEERSHAPARYETGAQQAAPLHELPVKTLLSLTYSLTFPKLHPMGRPPKESRGRSESPWSRPQARNPFVPLLSLPHSFT